MNWLDLAAAGLVDLAELAAPRACGGCGRAHRRWCPGCAQWLRAVLAEPPAGWAGRPIDDFPQCWSAIEHDGPLVRALPAYKDDGRVDLLSPLAAILRTALDGVHRNSPAVARAMRQRRLSLVCVPSTPASVRARGRLPLVDLTRAAVAGSPLVPAPSGTLRFARSVDDQGGLSATGRRTNLHGSMRARNLSGRTCLLVDDVLTTGATLAEAGRAVRAAGAREVIAVTMAQAVLRRDAGGTDEDTGRTMARFMDGSARVT